MCSRLKGSIYRSRAASCAEEVMSMVLSSRAVFFRAMVGARRTTQSRTRSQRSSWSTRSISRANSRRLTPKLHGTAPKFCRVYLKSCRIFRKFHGLVPNIHRTAPKFEFRRISKFRVRRLAPELHVEKQKNSVKWRNSSDHSRGICFQL